jgi:hypothetical protein
MQQTKARHKTRNRTRGRKQERKDADRAQRPVVCLEVTTNVPKRGDCKDLAGTAHETSRKSQRPRKRSMARNSRTEASECESVQRNRGETHWAQLKMSGSLRHRMRSGRFRRFRFRQYDISSFSVAQHSHESSAGRTFILTASRLNGLTNPSSQFCSPLVSSFSARLPQLIDDMLPSLANDQIQGTSHSCIIGPSLIRLASLAAASRFHKLCEIMQTGSYLLIPSITPGCRQTNCSRRVLPPSDRSP